MVTIPVAPLLPEATAVLAALGVPRGTRVPAGMAPVIAAARASFEVTARPRAVWQTIAPSEFAEVYAGEGDNEPETPLERVVPLARTLALFALTLGEEVSSQVRRLMDAGDVAEGAALDATASLSAEAAVAWLERSFAEALREPPPGHQVPAVLAYSPGYCGWHTSGQRRLFASLQPVEVGVELGRSCMMRPLKSVSGVLVAGAPGIHEVEPEFEFCDRCATVECRLRAERARRVAGRDGGSP